MMLKCSENIVQQITFVLKQNHVEKNSPKHAISPLKCAINDLLLIIVNEYLATTFRAIKYTYSL